MLDLQFVKSFGKVSSIAGARAPPLDRAQRALAAKNRKKIFNATTINLIDEDRKPARFAVCEIFAYDRQGHAARIVELFFRGAPFRELAERFVGES